MAAPLLRTKLYTPPVRAELVQRPRLIEQLNAGLHRKLTLISAPAGFGKTTLLSEWIAGCECPVAWVSLDGGDNDPARFWTYFTAAVQTVLEDVGDDVLAILQSPQPTPVEMLLTALINEIAEKSQRFAVVWDDYHVITTPTIHEALTFLLKHIPHNMSLIIATRVDPPLPLARLRARGQMTELRAADLRFTSGESAAFLNSVMGFNLSPGQIAVLESRAEGWIAGLQMAALSMKGKEDVDEFIAAFSGSHRYILDYLTEEVINQQPQSLQQFLLQTSILDRLSGPLCEAVTGQDGGQETLENLETANLFLTPLDDERRWYRYHRLFADLLRQRLYRLKGTQAGELHTRAADWYATHGFIPEAMKHALAAEDFDRAAGLVEIHGMEMLERGELRTVAHWAQAIPSEKARCRPRVLIYRAWATLLTGHTDQVEPLLVQAGDSIENVPGEAEAQDMRGQVTAIRAYLAALQGDIPAAIPQAEAALAQLGPENQGVRSVVTYILGGLRLISGDFESALERFTEAAKNGQAAQNRNIAIPAWCAVASLEMARGRLIKAEMIYRNALTLATTPAGRKLPMAAQPCHGLAQLAYERNELAAATSWLEQSFELSRQWRNPDTTVSSLLTRAALHVARGRIKAAVSDCEEAVVLTNKTMLTPTTISHLVAMRVRLWLETGQVDAAARLLDERGITAIEFPTYGHETEQVALARVLLAQAKFDEAEQLLERLIASAQADGRAGSLIRLLALEAIALQLQGRTDSAIQVLEHALSLGQPAGYVRTFADEGELMADLLSRMEAQSDRLKTYTQALLAAIPHPVHQPLAEPMTERELEVLRLIAEGLSNREIAEKLVIALGTVKAHTASIYGKLEVGNRTQAVARGREIGVL